MAIDRDEIDFPIDGWNGVERRPGKEPDRRGFWAGDSLEHDIERASSRVDRADDILIGFQRIRERTLGPIAELVQSGREPAVENDVELMREVDECRPFER